MGQHQDEEKEERSFTEVPLGKWFGLLLQAPQALKIPPLTTLNLFLVALWNACVLPNQLKFYYKNKINLTWVEIEKRTSHLKT